MARRGRFLRWAAALALMATAQVLGDDPPSGRPRPLVGLPTAGEPPLRADAGDDVSAPVGRQVTLNGNRSTPRGRVGYRWVQVGGPAVRLKIEEGPYYSFVPEAAGLYRFVLLVAGDRTISEPDAVDVQVGEAAGPAPTAAAPTRPTAEDQARSALATLPGGPEGGAALAEAFEGVADRMDLYRSAGEAFSELARRLEPNLPADPAARGAWDERAFRPLTGRIVEELRGAGLDLARPEGQAAPLAAAHRDRLAEVLQAMADGFRAAGKARGMADAVGSTERTRR